MRDAIDWGSWVAGWTALAFVVIYGVFVVVNTVANYRARQSLDCRILVTGSRGKSGTVRLVHAALSGQRRVYSKISGAAARELRADGTEINTPRAGTTSVCELPQSMRRAAKDNASIGVFECMAVTPKLIEMVQRVHIQAHMVIIPTIRLDHLEEEGLTEFEIGKSIFDAITTADVIVSAVEQPDIIEYYREQCEQRGIEFIHVNPAENHHRVTGHHPTNLAVALRVAAYLGVDREVALEGLQSVTFEPRVLSYQSITRDSGSVVSLVDIGSANDPQSAWEALDRLEFDSRVIVPVMVNRWERPLRAISFFASLRQHFSLVGVAGTLGSWMNSRHNQTAYRHSVDHERTEFFRVTRSMARRPEALAKDIERRLGRSVEHLVIVLVENNHEATTDLLRKRFDRLGEPLTLEAVEEKIS